MIELSNLTMHQAQFLLHITPTLVVANKNSHSCLISSVQGERDLKHSTHSFQDNFWTCPFIVTNQATTLYSNL